MYRSCEKEGRKHKKVQCLLIIHSLSTKIVILTIKYRRRAPIIQDRNVCFHLNYLFVASVTFCLRSKWKMSKSFHKSEDVFSTKNTYVRKSYASLSPSYFILALYSSTQVSLIWIFHELYIHLISNYLYILFTNSSLFIPN